MGRYLDFCKIISAPLFFNGPIVEGTLWRNEQILGIRIEFCVCPLAHNTGDVDGGGPVYCLFGTLEVCLLPSQCPILLELESI